MGFRPSLKGGCFLTTTTATAVPMCSRVRAPHVVLKARLPWVPFSSMWAYLCHSIGVFGSGQALEKPCTVLNWSLCSPAILWWIVKDMAYDNQFWSPVVWELFLGCCPGYLPVAESLPPQPRSLLLTSPSRTRTWKVLCLRVLAPIWGYHLLVLHRVS